MTREEDQHSPTRPVVYCLLPRELAPKLHELLRRHFRADPSVEVVVERRRGERRATSERRLVEAPSRRERRRIRSASGRRLGERRASLVPVEAPPLPRRAQRYAGRIAFAERIEPGTLHAEDLDTGRLVTRVQAGENETFAEIYMRYFDRIYGYLLVVLSSREEAEEGTQHVFVSAFDALPRYQLRGQPFRAWLFRIARNYGVDQLRRQARLEIAPPQDLRRRREECQPAEAEMPGLDWITDRELLLFIERLPIAQRQALVLRYTADLSDAQIGAILDRSPEDVRQLHSRAVRFLRERLTAIGRGSRGGNVRIRRLPREAPVLRARRWSLTR